MSYETFINRAEAGKLLAELLKKQSYSTPQIVALPRGGVPVAEKVAERFCSSLDVLIVRKIGAPKNPELGVGAIAEEGFCWINKKLLRELGISVDDLSGVIRAEEKEVERRIARYRSGKSFPSPENRTVILVDDGIATGATALVGAQWLKEKGASRVVLAAPICAAESAKFIREKGIELHCLDEPKILYSIGAWYQSFSQLKDEEVIRILEKNSRHLRMTTVPPHRGPPPQYG